MTIVRRLVGPAFSPLRIELSYPRPEHEDAYACLFRCAVRFFGKREPLDRRCSPARHALARSRRDNLQIAARPTRRPAEASLRRPRRTCRDLVRPSRQWDWPTYLSVRPANAEVFTRRKSDIYRISFSLRKF
ncbi:AraC family transcriptional regulator [Burkholderia cepacia]|uniref:AraC family transcriptional regulator ligand-binding domain-containing protein n=1 Tax=Burkholderia cepacia TaxID=292 RepID=UPI0018C8C925|nr:AraC family transcriptional regulator [Burkholderia cepacia]